MPPRSPLEYLTDEQRNELHRLLDTKVSFKDIETRMRAMGADTSSTAIHRYSKREFEPMQRVMRYTQQLQNCIRSEFGESGNAALSVLIEMLTSGVAKASVQTMLNDLDASDMAKELRPLVGMCLDLNKAQKANVDAAARIRKETAEQCAKAVTELPRGELGLTEATVQKIKATILGVAPQ